MHINIQININMLYNFWKK